MKRSIKSILGVTLLEIMLVLAIAAMVIVMSIRYYQSASQNQKVAASVDTVTGIMAAGENVLGGVGSLASFSSSMAAPYLPGGALPVSPWGGTISVSGTGTSTYIISITAPANACTMMGTLLTTQNTKITGVTNSSGSCTVSVNEAQ